MRAQLFPLDGSPPIEIKKDMVLIGRKEECDVRLEHRSVSKIHCILVKTDGLLLLRDLGSTNGTRVNGTRVRRAALLPNDQLSIAHFKFRVSLGPDVIEDARANERTLHLNSIEAADLVQQSPARADNDNASHEDDKPANGHLQCNQLPDVYPDQGTNSS